jgi:radical SAM protein with 4Fe4S-binding SPASM domain
MASSGEAQSDPCFINLEFAKVGIQDAINGYPTGIKADTLRFFSPGEPTQGFDVLRKCVEYTLKLAPDIKTELQTNGLFQSSADTRWISDHMDIVWFSLDGPPEINGRNRPDEFGRDRTEEIEENLTNVSSKTRVGVRATITSNTVARQEELIRYYNKLGVKHLAFNPLIRPIKRGDSGNKEVNEISQLEFAKGFIAAHNVATKLGVELTNSLTFNFDEQTTWACRSCLPMPQLNPDGSVSSCDMALYRDTKKELAVFLYGEWDNENRRIVYDSDKINKLQNRKLCNLDKCKQCKYGAYCAGGCAGRIVYETGDLYGHLPEVCAATHYMASRLPLGLHQYTATHP